jgi:hypothetical protein
MTFAFKDGAISFMCSDLKDEANEQIVMGSAASGRRFLGWDICLG